MIEIGDIGDGLTLKLFVLPKSSRNSVEGEHGGALKIKLTAPPVDGSANKLCIKFLSKILKIPKSRLEIVSGVTNRNKVLKVYYKEISGKKKEMDDFQNILNGIIL